MSNVIPILSSSPPPIDDTPSFEDGWDDNSDFGGFQEAGSTGGSPFSKRSCSSKSDQQAKSTDKPSNNPGQHNDDWADFSCTPVPPPPPVVDGEFVTYTTGDSKTGSSASVNAKDITLDDSLPASDLPSHMGLQLRSSNDRTVAHGDGRKSPRSSSSSTGSQDDRNNSCGEDFHARQHESKLPKVDTQDNTSQDSVTDSGLCSDISPVPKFEEYPDFGDNKSSEVDFSEDFQGKVTTILEQDEGFANFAMRDSCGTGSDSQSPERESLDQKPGSTSEIQHCPDPLDFRPVSFDDESPDADMQMGVFNCSSADIGSSHADLDPDATTPTQSQCDADNLRSSSSSSPDTKVSPDVSDNTGAECFTDVPQPSKTEEGWTDTNGSNETLEGSGAKSAEPDSTDSFADFQSSGSATNLQAFQGTENQVGNSSSSCDSSGAQFATGANSSHHSTADNMDSKEQPPPMFDSDDDDEWDFKDAVASEPSNDVASTQSFLATQEAESDSNNDFGDFACQSQQKENRDGDDSAFQDGSIPPVAQGETNNDEEANDEDDDDFGDFCAEFGDNKHIDDDNNNWASFAEPVQPGPAAGEEDDEDTEFGDFGDADFASAEKERYIPQTSAVHVVSQAPSQQIVTPQQVLKKTIVDDMVKRIFAPPVVCDDLPSVDLLYTHMTRQDFRQDPVSTKQTARQSNVKSTPIDMNVWNSLRDLEKTAALRYTWDKSSNSACLLTALSIDTRNILIGHKKPSVPIFAANLGSGMLEPSRGVPEAGREGRVSDVNTINVNVNTIKLTAGTPQDIPPAEFDWSSAGLTNPLDSSNIQLDLDFFVKKTAWSCYSAYTATSPTAALENELLKSIEPLESRQPKTLEPLADYLANLKVASTAPPSMNQESDSDHLSEAAYEIVSRFPQTAFMHAKMLMFPVKGSAD